jgi:NTP pyrophosphatase (non-canonical NTP hydrolase)
MPDAAITTTLQDMIVKAILNERDEQDNKWGVQKHSHTKWLAILVEEVGEVALSVNEICPALGELKERAKLNDIKELRTELIQTAAVCVAWLEHIDGRIGL